MRLFGYVNHLTLHPTEPDHIREAARRVIDGESLRAIESDFNDRAIVTTTGRAWSQGVLRRTLKSPRLAGLKRVDGELVDAKSPAILDRATWDHLQQILEERKPPATAPIEERTYLLTGGIARCGACGKPLRAGPIAGRRNYRCATASGGCGTIRIDGERFDEHVIEEVTAALPLSRTQTVLDGLQRRAEAAQSDVIDAVARRRAAIQDDQRKGRRDVEQTRQAMNDLSGDVLAARRTIDAYEILRDVLELDHDDLLTWWDTASLESKRALIAAIVESVDVFAARSRGRFDPDRIAIRWR